MRKDSKLYSVVTGTCPRCHEGRIFSVKNSYNLRHLTEMNARCPKCDLSYRREPGFYIGAGYVSYSLGVAIIVTVAVGMSPWIDFFTNFEIYAAATISAVIILTPLIYRLSRIIWLNIFIRYEKNAIKEYNESQQNLTEV